MSRPSPFSDPLTLPPVPPPAASVHPLRDGVMVLLFALAIVWPLIGLVSLHSRTVLPFERRAAAAWPAPPASLDALRRWGREFDAAFADRFGGRDALIDFEHRAVVTFGVSPVWNVMIGRDGWLYWLGEDGKSVDRDYRGVVAYPDGEPSAVASELKRRRDWLAERGIAYVVMIVPDKHTIYPEHLPDWAARRATPTRLDRVYAALRAYPDVDAIDLRPWLLEAKAAQRVYYKTDSHWNYNGAIVAYNRLTAELSNAVPSYHATTPWRPPYIAGEDYWSGDLSITLGLLKRFREDDVAPLAKVMLAADTRCARLVDEKLPEAIYPPAFDPQVYRCARPGLPSAIVYRDSMSIPLIPLLSEGFGRVVYVTSRAIDPAQIARERPDVVIEEIVERGVGAPAMYPLH